MEKGRIIKSLEILDLQYFIKAVKNYHSYVPDKESENKSHKSSNDSSKLIKIIQFTFAFKIFKNICLLLILSYFLGVIFYIFSDIMEYDVYAS